MRELKTIKEMTKEINGKFFSFEIEIEATLKQVDGYAVYNTVRKVIVGSSSKEVDFATFTITQTINKDESFVNVTELISSFNKEDLKAVKKVSLNCLGLQSSVTKINENPLLLEYIGFDFNEYETYSQFRFEVDAFAEDENNLKYGAYGSFYICDDGTNSTYLKAFDNAEKWTWKPDLSFDIKKNDFVVTNQDSVNYEDCRELVLFVNKIPDEALRMLKDKTYFKEVFDSSKKLKEVLRVW